MNWGELEEWPAPSAGAAAGIDRICYSFSMELKERIETAVAAGWTKIESERKADADFRTEWDKARKLVSAILKEAADSLREKLGPASHEPRNGCNRLIATKRIPGQDKECTYHLDFCPNPKTRKVVCTSSLKDLLESEVFDLASLDRTTVEDKVVHFVEAVMKSLATHVK